MNKLRNLINKHKKRYKNKLNGQTLCCEAYNNQHTVNLALLEYTLLKSRAEFNYNKSVGVNYDVMEEFRKRAFFYCHCMYDTIKDVYNNVGCQVTILEKDKDVVTMVSYSNNNGITPGSYGTEFKVTDENNKNIYFIKIFNENVDIAYIADKESVQKEFVWLDGSEEREKKICQYVSACITDEVSETGLLIQVDVDKEWVFGKNTEELYSFCHELLYPCVVDIYREYIQSRNLQKITMEVNKLNNYYKSKLG